MSFLLGIGVAFLLLVVGAVVFFLRNPLIK